MSVNVALRLPAGAVPLKVLAGGLKLSVRELAEAGTPPMARITKRASAGNTTPIHRFLIISIFPSASFV